MPTRTAACYDSREQLARREGQEVKQHADGVEVTYRNSRYRGSWAVKDRCACMTSLCGQQSQAFQTKGKRRTPKERRLGSMLMA